MSQKANIWNYLSSGGTLTVTEAIEKFGCYALSQRAGELRRMGLPIISEMITTPTGKHIARYKAAIQLDLEL